MSSPTGSRAPKPGGAAQELPAGRLSSFEDDDTAPDLASLLSRRSARPTIRPETSPPAADAGTEEARPAPTTAPTVPTDRDEAPAAPKPTDPEGAPDAPRSTARRAERPRRNSPRQQAGANTSQHGDQPAAPAAANRIRSSSVHIPAALIDRVIAERERTGRSNGEIVIAALEQTHRQLPKMFGQRDPTGGGLFASRPSRGARLTDGPLTPLNVRLFEADYDVIDQLVASCGAFSRGHLISTALTAYFARPATPDRSVAP